jgi:hypothetical protein
MTSTRQSLRTGGLEGTERATVFGCVQVRSGPLLVASLAAPSVDQIIAVPIVPVVERLPAVRMGD